MPNDQGKWPAWRPSTSAVGLGVLAVLFIIATFSAMALQRRSDLMRDRQVNNERLVDSLAEHTGSIFRQSSLVLAMVGERLDRETRLSPHDPAFKEFLAHLLLHAPMVAAIRVIAPEGRYLHSYPEQPPAGAVVADRDYLLVHGQGGSGIFLGKPIISRVNGKRVLPVSRAHRTPDGKLVAVVALMIRLDHLNEQFESIRQKPNGAIALFNTDGTMLSRGPLDETMIGKDFSQGPLFREQLTKAQAGSYINVVATDGQLRQASYRVLDGLPAVVAVSTLHDDTMAQWKGYAATLLIIAIPLVLAAMTITWAMHRQLVARESFERLLARRGADLELANEELRHMAEISAHHLQEPLRTVLSYAQLLVRKTGSGENGEINEYLGFIRSGIERMKSQMDALQRYLGVSQIRPHEPVSLSRVLAETMDLLEPRIAMAEAEIRARNLPDIMGDRQHLAGLFHHMISAILERRRPDTYQKISLGAERDGEMWHLLVRADNTDIDFGEGETVFPLMGPGSTPARGRGPTLSLAICRKVAQIHGGKMWGETTEDGEVRLHLLLPVEQMPG
ncbi:Phytochrome two-component sensor histidine kinase [Paramagnetospirillum magnetotacticum MS-1]|uniref:histidine kinase n=1 Tax=Paramagnetospirillum magnetotacticum MS-1 TaxID=272627 RepID=A0A0C2YVI7_PARME|nr:sensor histidine kinase [Paramagnetospirillum magnetotacticum]KIL99113.1 Phytochrome two-component sensor histidine kinase [Paramagnetospirillum magnetotacticum MS-1]